MLLGEPSRDGAATATAQSGDELTRALPKLRHRRLCNSRRSAPWQQRVLDAPSHKLVEVILPPHWRQEGCLTRGSDTDDSVGEEDDKKGNDAGTRSRHRVQLRDGEVEERAAREALARLQRDFDGLKRSISERVVQELRARGFAPPSTVYRGETLPEFCDNRASGLVGGNQVSHRGGELRRGPHGHAVASSLTADEGPSVDVKQEKPEGKGTPDIDCFMVVQRGRECEPRRADLREWPPLRPVFVYSSPSRCGPPTEDSSRESSVSSSLACRRRMKGLTPVQTRRGGTKKEEGSDRTSGSHENSPCLSEDGSSHGFSAPGDEDCGMNAPSVRGSLTSSGGCSGHGGDASFDKGGGSSAQAVVRARGPSAKKSGYPSLNETQICLRVFGFSCKQSEKRRSSSCQGRPWPMQIHGSTDVVMSPGVVDAGSDCRRSWCCSPCPPL